MKLDVNDDRFSTMNKQNGNVESRRPKVLVNNFMLDNSMDKQRSKSVLFSANDNKRQSIPREDNLNKSNLIRTPFKGQHSNGPGPQKRVSESSDRRDSLKAPTPSLSRKSSVSRTRRVSVRSTDSRASRLTRGRSESMSSDSTDECISVLNSSCSTTAWNLFEDHVRSVHVASDFAARKSRISFASSDTFQKTMTDLYGNPIYGYEPEPHKIAGNISNVASRLLASTRRRRKLRNEAISEVQERPPPSKTVIENARRGWRVIRRYVNEMIAEKKGSNAAFNWNMLKQTMKGLTDMDRARIDMYKRYGVIPTVLPDGTTVQENTMLSEKARAASAKNSEVSQTSVSRPKTRHSVYSRMRVHASVRSRAS